MKSEFIDKKTVQRLRSCIGSEDWLPMEIMVETGLRVGDVVALRRSQIRQRDGVPVIEYVAQKTGKQGSAQISEGLYKRLSKRKAGFLFPGRGKTRHITRQALWRRLKRACADLGIDPAGISPHSLRKCFAVALRHERGVEAVREALQHSSDAVTRVYAYADTVMKFTSDEPIRWIDLELIVEYILERLREGG